jgi:adenylate cyclase
MVYSGSPAIMQFGRNGKLVFRSATVLMSAMAFVDRGMLCQQINSLIASGRADYGPVYHHSFTGGEPAFTYVNATNVFYFSTVQ